MATLIRSKHLEGINDLTLTAPVKSGFIHSTESVTYETRLRLVMKALFEMRSTAREYSLIKPFVDTAERIEALLDFRLTILDGRPALGGRPRLDGEQSILVLSATFDRPFEPYMRLIWNPLGPLLDVIFCNCEGYVTAHGHDFETYLKWVRDSQVDANFFYAASGHTVGDVQYLSKIERLLREARRGECDAAAAEATSDNPEATARRVINARVNRLESDQMGIEALVSLHRLATLYPPNGPGDLPDAPKEGAILLRAARGLLGGWDTSRLPPPVAQRFREQLAWFNSTTDPAGAAAPAAPPAPEPLEFHPQDIQGGILTGYDRPGEAITHGCLLLMRVTEPAAARQFIASLIPQIRAEGTAPGVQPVPEQVYLNIAFTRHGLVNLGLPPEKMEKFPQEFREGMEDRAGLLGDVRGSHPRRWNLPERNWPPRPSGAAAAPPVEMAEIDIVLQLRTSSDYDGHELLGDENHPLRGRVEVLAAAAEASGVDLLSVQSMRRAARGKGDDIRTHFGFADGLSQPVVAPARLPSWSDAVSRGEILRGYANDRGDPPPPRDDLLDNCTFLVVRKLQQDVAGLEAFVKEQAAAIPQLTEEDLYAKMMGRRRDGAPLLAGTSAQSNVFDYEDDPKADACPFQSHIRRTNPRTVVHGRPTPRIMRRGMSFGPPSGIESDEKRGVFFMAYNASIAEQYEVIQRWLTGGNSTSVATCQSDPLMGVAQGGDPRTFRFKLNGEVIRVEIPKPFVTLDWGAYLFVPSFAALRTIANGIRAQSDEVERGRKIVDELLAQPAAKAALMWKTCIEDFYAKDPAERSDASAVWAAIRAYHRGAIKVPYGDTSADPSAQVREVVLVASDELVNRVYGDDAHYSVCGYDNRMTDSFGPIFLGRDPGTAYDEEAEPTNAAIMAVDAKDAFDVAYSAAQAVLGRLLGLTAQLTGKRELELDLTAEFITPALAMVCRRYFGIPDEPLTPQAAGAGPVFVAQGGWSWTPVAERLPRCPGDYMQPSRYCFYPDPGPSVVRYGQEHGRRLTAQVQAYFEAMIAAGKVPQAPLSLAIFNALKDKPDRLASTVVGVMTGFLPPTDGNLRSVLYEWIEEKTLWRVQRDFDRARNGPLTYDAAKSVLFDPLRSAIQKRPAPDLVWRTARDDHELGGVQVKAGDKIIIGIVSATMEKASAGDPDVYAVFGGDRRARSHPTHACPAYEFAMGTMIGILSALLEVGRIETMPAPLIVKLTDLRPQPGG